MFSIASGSSGNCVYIGTDEVHILVDAGISAKRICNGLADNFLQASDLDAIFITHEHSDHICGLSVLLKKYRVPVYGTKETLACIQNSKCGCELPSDLFHPILPGGQLVLGDMTIDVFSVSHDASNPVAYTFRNGEKKIAMATDLGYADETIAGHLRDADLIYIESNYDRNMLLVGIYPYYLKQRILGMKGHLSNDDSAQLIHNVMNERLRYIILAHLSKENNYPELAFQTMKNEIHASWSYPCDPPELIVASRDLPIACISL